MRNLKRALSLTLASVMLLGMMVVGAGAASYSDVSDEHNVEAIEVVNALGIMQGTGDGFDPDRVVSRVEMAAVVSRMLGFDLDSFDGAETFPDVPDWAVAAVAACQSEGIVGGYPNGTFGSADPVNAVQAATMMLRVLGYFQHGEEDYNGQPWNRAVINQVAKIKLFDGIDARETEGLTRNEVAKLVLNTVEAKTVESNCEPAITLNGETIKPHTVKYDEDMVLAEKLYDEDLKKETAEDDFGRPATKWTYEEETVGAFAKSPKLVIAGEDFKFADDLDDYEVTDKTKFLYNGLSIADWDKDNKTKFDGKNGVQVEVYVDSDKITHVVAIEGYVAEMTTVNTDDDDKVTDVVVTIYEAGRAISGTGEYDMPIDVKKDKDAYELVKNYDENDVFMVFVKPGWDKDTSDAKDLLAVDDVDAIDGEVTTISADAQYNGWVKVDGVKYEFANEYSQEAMGAKSEGTFYLYNGFVVHYDGEAAASSDDYLYVARAGEKEGDFKETTYYAEVVFADGTSKVIDTKTLADQYSVYSYKYNEKKEYYELTPAGDAVKTTTITKGKTALGTGTSGTVFTADGQTVYVAVKFGDKGAFDSAKVYTGYKNVPTMEGTIIVVAEKDKAADYVFVLNGKTAASADDMIYIAGNGSLVDDKDLGKYYLYNAVVDGEIVEIMVDADTDKADSLSGLYTSYAVDEDGIYSDLSAATEGANKDYLQTTGNFKKASNEVITVGNAGTMAYTDDVTVFVVDTDGKITTGSINRNYTQADGKTNTILYTVNDDAAVTSLYIVKA